MRIFESIRNKILESHSQTAPEVYAGVHYAKWCVKTYKWAGTYTNGMPNVYHYDDCNGEHPYWSIMPIDQTTSGFIATWGFDEQAVARTVQVLNTNRKPLTMPLNNNTTTLDK